MTSLYKDLEFRGLVKQSTDPSLESVLGKESLTLYCGFDPTSDSLHIGSLLPVLTLRRFQLAGHKVIAVVGGATGMIGDPSGKAAERTLLSPADLAKNQKGITDVLSKFLDMRGTSSVKPAIVVNNAAWFNGVSFLDFLRDVGKHFTVNHMLGKESVRARLEDREHGISYTEFSYMLLQAYDFYVLNRDQGCRLQIGGSDQWGNITAGIELTRRMKAHLNRDVSVPVAAAGSSTEAKAPDLFGLTQPLVMKADGSKFGKSEGGNIWLSADKTAPYSFYQYLLQTADADVITLLKYFTFLPHEEIQRIEGLVKTAPEKREAQATLARELMLIVHGESEYLKAESASKALFGGDLKALSPQMLEEVFKEAPSTRMARSQFEGEGMSLVDLLAATAICASKGVARKDVEAGAISINNEKIQDVGAKIKFSQALSGKYFVLRKGKKTYHLVALI